MTFTPTIEAGLPIPPSSCPYQPKPVPFGLDRLNPGDSAFVPVSAYPAAAAKNGSGRAYLQTYLTASLRGHRETKARKFVSRQMGDGVRIWRTI